MPWVRLDDRFPSHRKVALLSDRGFRLYVSALCWASENLTEGLIHDRELPLVARLRGVKAAAKELEDAHLWDRVEGGWQIHDYLEYNPDRARVQADREANAARQKAFRDRKRAERDAARNAQSNGVTPGSDGHENDATATPTRHDGDTTAQRTDRTNGQSAQVSGIRNGVSNDTPSPSPSRPVLPTEVPPPPSPSNQPADRNAVEVSGRGEVQPLIEAMAARDMNVSWTFQAAEWIDLRDAVRRVGIPALVDHAARVWQAAKTTPYSARYFLPGWTGLQNAPAYTGPRAITGPPSKTQEYLEDMAAIAEELRQQQKGTA
jgi:cytoskeletal protein RodZ